MAHVDFCGVGDASIQRPFVLSEYLQGTLVDVTGRTLHESGPLDTGDLQWFTRNVLAQALTNGYGAIPILAGPCPHPNARLNCAHFRTDISFLEAHKSELRETDRVIAKATANGWARQIEIMNANGITSSTSSRPWSERMQRNTTSLKQSARQRSNRRWSAPCQGCTDRKLGRGTSTFGVLLLKQKSQPRGCMVLASCVLVSCAHADTIVFSMMLKRRQMALE
jgi:hypothetical protein